MALGLTGINPKKGQNGTEINLRLTQKVERYGIGINLGLTFFLIDSRSSKSTQDCGWESGSLQHMIQWIPAKRGTWQRPRVHMRITEGSLMR